MYIISIVLRPVNIALESSVKDTIIIISLKIGFTFIKSRMWIYINCHPW